MYRRFGKRWLDLTLTCVALVVLSPLLLVICVLILGDLGRPILFRQPRIGLRGAPFIAYKFRSLREALDANGNVLPDDSDEAYELARSGARSTRIGSFLRQSSLDELGGLVNVLKGEMSLVGPRALVTRYLDRYTPEQMRRHEVLPGITGLAQINGRQDLPFEQRFELDVWYVDHLSLRLDLSILLRTPIEVLRRRGASESGYATGTEFMGTNEPRQE
jgi:lipopolysaccharide/colanic/teichoic acid biosynthesis glycosyltransferase